MILFGRVVDIRGWLQRKLRFRWEKGRNGKERLQGAKEPAAEYDTTERRIITLLLLFFLIGIVAMNLCGMHFAERMEELSPEGLIALRDAQINGTLFVKRLLLRRAMILCGIIGISVTRPGEWICRLLTAWLGFSVGSFFAALSLLYGLKGQLLGLVWCLPQGILYGPAFVFLMKWGSGIHEIGQLSAGSTMKRRAIAWKCMELVGIGLLTFVGCLSEGYLNPLFLQSCLRRF